VVVVVIALLWLPFLSNKGVIIFEFHAIIIYFNWKCYIVHFLFGFGLYIF